ncbi:hypothetical protein B0A48_07755 [Cryoendolithus antarcticus]|uniref:tRNA(Phe) 7-[(3-amino-3-carboxypropyl)-4-demethylwyosine(37)-N(4)]-methyltransferase n=1 Tax=Cryoendolithus antarcticus TaxID=1507870 RepID=A0A1V8T701_9PEZI|nr:hypothetical protein B0A48_07755 [Cryoendolithus antarcticus]
MTTPFTAKKAHILSQLAVPDSDYSDLSPIGAVDPNIRQLVHEINELEGFVTTSSCSGRIAVYLEGSPKTSSLSTEDDSVTAKTTTGGKGGGQWLYVSHDPLRVDDTDEPSIVLALLNLPTSNSIVFPAHVNSTRYIHLKFEPLILHILCPSLSHAQHALSAALTSGFRESGISSINVDGMVMVAVRTAGLAFDSIIGFANDTGLQSLMVTEQYLRTLIAVANARFVVNEKRKGRFRETLLHAVSKPAHGEKGDEWEPTHARRERKRAEGLQRKADAERLRSEQNVAAKVDGLDGG